MGAPGTETQRELEIPEVDPSEGVPALEALLFASGEAEDIATLSAALGWPPASVRSGLDALDTELRATNRGITLQRDGDRVQLVSAPKFGQVVARLLGMERSARLSSAAMETLALVAYRQPITRVEIEAIRGVDSSGVVATLVARELIESRGRRSTPGNPVEYATTSSFLQFFGLTSLADLPPLSD